MKKKEAKEFIYEIRCKIIEEIGEHERIQEECGKGYLYTNFKSFEYGYNRGLTEAAMIMLDEIYRKWPEENKPYNDEYD